MNAKANVVQILAEKNPDTFAGLPSHRFFTGEWENPAGPRWAEGIPLIHRTGEDRGEKTMVVSSGRAFMPACIAFPSAVAVELWEVLASLLLWLSGLLAIGICLF